MAIYEALRGDIVGYDDNESSLVPNTESHQ
jgi:hypothetical protein